MPKLTLPDPYNHPQPWLDLVSSPRWKTILHDVVDRDLVELPASVGTKQTVDFNNTAERERVKALHPCPQCPRDSVQVFETAAALTQHRVRHHGHRNTFQSYVRPSKCPNCGREYWTRRRAIDHITYRSAVCNREGLLAISNGTWVPLSDVEVRKLRDNDLKANAADRKCGRSFLLANRHGPKCGRKR